MRLTDFLTDVGRPVAYYPKLARALGSINAALFACQLVYWSDKGSDPDGWIYKTAEEWEEELGLSYKEQAAARKRLKALRILEEKHDRLNHRMYYRLDFDGLNELWDGYFPNCPKVNSGNDQRSVRELTKGQLVKWYSETTAENTKKYTREDWRGQAAPARPPSGSHFRQRRNPAFRGNRRDWRRQVERCATAAPGPPRPRTPGRGGFAGVVLPTDPPAGSANQD